MTTTEKTPTEEQLDAFKLGRKSIGLSVYEQADLVAHVTHSYDLMWWFDEGASGGPIPAWTSGWRYHAVPECGHSYNFRDDRYEPGVSMMAVDGSDATPDGTYALFNGDDAKRTNVAGWLSCRTGSDGEPLLWVGGRDRVNA